MGEGSNSLKPAIYRSVPLPPILTAGALPPKYSNGAKRFRYSGTRLFPIAPLSQHHPSKPIQLPTAVPPSLQPQCRAWRDLLQATDWVASLGWQPNPSQLEQLERLYEVVILGNTLLNLTRLTEPSEFWEKHLWDSLRGLLSLGSWDELTEQSLTAIDIGSGPGFPGLPAAIALPNGSFALLDSTKRKVDYLQQAIDRVELSNTAAIASRVELLSQREQYDLAILRAIGPAEVCAEYCFPLLKQGGRAILYRGRWTLEEESTLATAAEILGGEIATVDAFATPTSQSVRHCIVLQKTAETPAKFPRAPGFAARQPLGCKR